MSYGKERTGPAGRWEGLAGAGGLPTEQIQALAAVRPLEAIHSLLRGLTGRNSREMLVRAAVLEALASQPYTEAGIEEALSWLGEPARGDILRALHRSGWLEEPDPADPTGTIALTGIGRQIWQALRRAVDPKPAPAPPLLPPGITPDQVVRALLARGLEGLAAAGREALVPIVPAQPFLNAEGVAWAAETQARGAVITDPAAPDTSDTPGEKERNRRR